MYSVHSIFSLAKKPFCFKTIFFFKLNRCIYILTSQFLIEFFFNCSTGFFFFYYFFLGVWELGWDMVFIASHYIRGMIDMNPFKIIGKKPFSKHQSFFTPCVSLCLSLNRQLGGLLRWLHSWCLFSEHGLST